MRYNEIKPLMEINMSPSNLQTLASNIDATVGIEFEMYISGVPTPKQENDGFDTNTPDFTNDPRIESYDFDDLSDQIIDFFIGGDEYNDSNEVRAMINTIKKKIEDFAEDYHGDNKDDINEMTFQYLRSNTITTMKDIWGNFGVSKIYDINWPYVKSNEFDMDKIEHIASNFEKHMLSNVDVLDEYHGDDDDIRGSNWIIEPDGSLNNSSKNNDGGWEFVSPAMPLNDMIKTLNKIAEFADDNNCYTNTSCGLHINVSIDGLDMNNVDYIKLALLLGDDYILKQFGRESNRHAERAIGQISYVLDQKDTIIDFQNMKNNLTLFSKKLFYGNSQKSVSINAKHDNRIEFRSPGGDWLNDLNNNPDKIINTIYRMVVALDAAMDKNKYRKEYITKFYKLLSQNIPNKSGVEMFVRYCAGEISINELKNTLNARHGKFKNNLNYNLYKISGQNFNPRRPSSGGFEFYGVSELTAREIKDSALSMHGDSLVSFECEKEEHDLMWKACLAEPTLDDVFKVIRFYKTYDEIPSTYKTDPYYMVIPPSK